MSFSRETIARLLLRRAVRLRGQDEESQKEEAPAEESEKEAPDSDDEVKTKIIEKVKEKMKGKNKQEEVPKAEPEAPKEAPEEKTEEPSRKKETPDVGNLAVTASIRTASVCVAFDVSDLSMDMEVTPENASDVLKAISEAYKNKDEYGEYGGPVEEAPSEEVPQAETRQVDPNDVIDLFSRTVDMVTLLIKANPPRIRKSSEDYEEQIDRAADEYLMLARVIVGNWEDGGKAPGGNIRWKWRGKDYVVERIQQNKPGTEPTAHEIEVAKSVQRPEKKEEEAPKKEAPKEEAPKKEAPKEEKSLHDILQEGLEDEGEEAPEEEEKPDWFKSDDPLDPTNAEQMIGRGFKRQEADLADDTTLVDVTTGKRYKLSELPQELQDAVRDLNKDKGMWHTPAGAATPAEEAPAEEAPAEEAPAEEAPAEEAPAEEAPAEEAPAEEAPVEEAPAEEPEPEGKLKPDVVKEKKPEKPQKPKKRLKVDRGVKDLLDGMAGHRDDIDAAMIAFDGLNTQEKEELWAQWTEGLKRKRFDINKFIDRVLAWHGEQSGAKAASISERVAGAHMEALVERVMMALVKDKDLMSDTGGTGKGRLREPELKPSREDCKDRYRTRRKTKDQIDKDTEQDPDLS